MAARDPYAALLASDRHIFGTDTTGCIFCAPSDEAAARGVLLRLRITPLEYWPKAEIDGGHLYLMPLPGRAGVVRAIAWLVGPTEFQRLLGANPNTSHIDPERDMRRGRKRLQDLPK